MIYLESFGNFFPSFEKEEIEKIFKQHHYGNVEKIWVTPGLLLASTDGDQVLHPICTHSAASSSSSVHWSLHIQTESTVLDVLINANPCNPALATIIYVVEESGHVQCWQQSNTTYVWKMVYRLHLANSHVDVLTPSDPLTSSDVTSTRVTSACLLPEHHLLYWCEQQQRQGTNRNRNTVYKLQLPGSTIEDSSSQKMPIERQTILQNCPPCSLYSLSCSILIIPDEMMKSGVPLGIVFTPMQSSCVLYFGKTAVHHQISMKSGEPLNFKAILLQYQDVVKKTFGQFAPVLGSVFQHVKQEFIIILQSGQIFIWRETVLENEVISKELSSFCDVSSDTKWTVSQDWLFATNTQETKVWNLTNGECLQRITHTNEQAMGVFMVMKTLQVSGLFTNEAIYLWQQEPPPVITGCLPPNNHYRSEALNVALLDQEKFQTESLSAQRKLKELEKNWSQFKHQRAPTDYTRLTDPFLESYWLLEDFWQNAILSEEKVINPFPFNGSLEEIIRQLLNPSSNLPPETRQVQLMILANQYPALILATFKTFLDFNSDVSEKNLPVWQFVLSLDNNDLNRTNMNSQVFEIICQVIFKEEPQNLVPFVMKTNRVSGNFYMSP
ncbi:uncharacterized protein LOC115226573 [Octopus sinensis]|uniref:Uncharacterized protein LOC115226573 n=1 Tax=Octopus sinensis TaxID=2607531 RepID=A0A6P7TU62_9MOLL|nr:uncharacterized protein LOC115226573 [Octopus sinensis]